MNSKEYWQERERKALRERIKEEQSYIRRVNGIHDDMLDKIQKEIDSFYQKYAIKEHISLAEAKKRVSQLDIKAYEEKARRYVEDKDLSPQANREMRLYNLTMKVNRLEMLKARIGMAMVDSFDGMNNFYEEVLSKRAMDEYKRQAGILGKSVINPEKKAKALVNASFKSATGKYGFSDVLWTQQTFMKAELSKLLQQGIMQGKGPRELAPQLQKIFGVEKYACERLMRTELARVQIEAQRQSFEENGYDEYQFITLSSAPYTKSKVCPICADLNGKHFKVKDMKIGENAPPMHPNCRCSIAAYMDPDEFEKWLDEHSNNVLDNGIDTNYNNSPGQVADTTKLEKIYKEDVENGWISPLSGFVNYLKQYLELRKSVVGKTTTDGIKITGISRHFMQRVIGTRVDPKIYKEEHKIVRRSGVPPEDIEDAIVNGTLKKTRVNKDGQMSHKYVGKKCVVTVNPKTGKLIQCNPF